MNADYTKKMIMENLINLLNRMPLNKITVGKLAEECGINRNTIYYHFKDLNQIIDTIFEIRLKRVLNESDNISWEDSFIEEMQFAIDNKTAIFHIYNSISRKTLSDYLYNKSGQIMRTYVENVDKEIHAKKDDKEIVIKFFQSAITDLIIRWLNSGMDEDIEENIKRIGFLLKDTVKSSLTRSKMN